MSRYLSFVALVGLLATNAFGQDAGALERMYGTGVHAYYEHQYGLAKDSLSTVIEAGTRDPRPYYFRAMVNLATGNNSAAQSDMAQGAELESLDIDGNYNVARSLERVQGSGRLALERHRLKARLANYQRLEQRNRDRYENLQRQDAQVLRNQVDIPLGGVDGSDASAPAGDPFEDPSGPAAGTPAPMEEMPAQPKSTAAPADDPFGAPAAEPAPAAAPADDPFGAPAAEPAPAAAPADDPFGAPAAEPAPAAAPADDPFGAPAAEPAPAAAPADDPFGAPAAEDAAPPADDAAADDPFAANPNNAAPPDGGAPPPAGAGEGKVTTGLLGRVLGRAIGRGLAGDAPAAGVAPPAGDEPMNAPPAADAADPFGDDPPAAAPAADPADDPFGAAPAAAAPADDAADPFGDDAPAAAPADDAEMAEDAADDPFN